MLLASSGRGARDAANFLQSTGQPPPQRMIWPDLSTVPGIRSTLVVVPGSRQTVRFYFGNDGERQLFVPSKADSIALLSFVRRFPLTDCHSRQEQTQTALRMVIFPGG